VSRTAEIKQRMERLSELSNKMKGHLDRFKGPEGEATKQKAKKAGTRFGVGAGVSIFGIMIAAVAGLYFMALVIILLDLALPLWASALIVIVGSLLLGIIVIAIGAGVASPGAKELSAMQAETTREMKQTGEEIKAEVEGLQNALKAQSQELAGQAKTMAPVAAAGCVVMWLVKRKIRSHREKKRILKVIEMYDESKAEADLFAD